METITDLLFKIFERELPSYYKSTSIRTSQVQMAFDIADFIQPNNSKKIMIVEAPVGTGKSLGALIPTLLDIDNNTFSKRKIIYATATINLQNQIMNSEVPLLKKLSLLKSPILAMGKTNYYCHKRFLKSKEKFSPKEQEIFREFFTKAVSGQRNELEDKFEHDFSEVKWKEVALEASKSECGFCKFSLSCPTNQHRNNFKSPDNDLIVTNHDQYIVSVLNEMSESERPSILPINPGILIIDEAHHFLDNFLGRLEETFTIKSLKSLVKHLSRGLKLKLLKHIKVIEVTLKNEIRGIGDSLQGRYPISQTIITELRMIKKIVNQRIDEFEASYIFNRVTNYHATEYLEEWFMLLDKVLDDKYVKWIEYEEMKISAISNNFPSDFRKMMDVIKAHNKIIIMSGTLTENGNFDTLINQWRLRKNEVVTKRFDTPFDYKNQAMLYVPETVADPRNEKFIESSIEVIKSMINLTDGRTLVLSTSKVHMTTIWENIKDFISRKNLRLLLQGNSGVEKLTKQFRDDETSVLIGTGSFFSGFSIPGPSLTSVILTKLPFPVRDDPFLTLIGQGFEEDFFELIIYPNMVNKLNQAAGRLIRSIDDFGIFTILDSRIYTEQYGKAIQEMFINQGYNITRSFEAVQDFYENKITSGSNAIYDVYSRDRIQVSDKLNIIIKKDSKVKSKSIDANAKAKIKKPREAGVTKEQREFFKLISEKFGIRMKKSNRVSDIFRDLISSLYLEWRDDDIKYVKENFPYKDEKQKNDLQEIKGYSRKTIMPLCSKFGCLGNCKSKDVIEQYLKDKYDPDEIKFINNSRLCRIFVSPVEILENEEFRPK